MSEPREIHPLQMDGKHEKDVADFRIQYEETVDPKGSSALKPVVSSDSVQTSVVTEVKTVSAEKVITKPKVTETSSPTSQPVTSVGKPTQPAKA